MNLISNFFLSTHIERSVGRTKNAICIIKCHPQCSFSMLRLFLSICRLYICWLRRSSSVMHSTVDDFHFHWTTHTDLCLILDLASDFSLCFTRLQINFCTLYTPVKGFIPYTRSETCNISRSWQSDQIIFTIFE